MGCFSCKEQNYVLSNLKDAVVICEILHINSDEGPEFSYDVFIKEMIKHLIDENQLHNHLMLVNNDCDFDYVSTSRKKRKKEFNVKASEELKLAYHIGLRKEDGAMGFSTWDENDTTDERIIALYKKVNARVKNDFGLRRGAPHSIISSLINDAECCRLKEKQKEYGSYMKKQAWHMFPYHIIREILTLIDESNSNKKKQLTDLFEEVLLTNKSIAIEPTGEKQNIGYDMKDNNTSLRKRRRSENIIQKNKRNRNGMF